MADAAQVDDWVTPGAPASQQRSQADDWVVPKGTNVSQETNVPPTEAQSWLSSPGARFARDALADPLLSASHFLSTGAENIASLGGETPNPLSDYYGAVANATNRTQTAIDQPMDTANAAARTTPGYKAAQPAATTAEHAGSLGALDQVTAPVLPAADAAYAYAAQAGKNVGRELSGEPVTTTAADAANATADAEAKELSDYRATHPVVSTIAALAPALLSFGEAGFPAARNLAKTGSLRAVVPAVAELKRAASAAYQTVDNSGMIIAQPSVRNLVTQIQSDLAAQGFHPTLQPRTAAAFDMLDQAADNNQTLQGMDVLRRVAQHGVDPLNKSDTMMSRRVVDSIDNFVDGLGPADVIGNVDQHALDALGNARDLWARAAKGQQIQDLIDKASLNSKSMIGNAPGLGSGNALRTQFRQLANNPRGMARFSPAEQAAIRRTATGGPIENVLRMVGKLAPDQTIPLMTELGATAAGGPAALAVPVAGAAAKLGASAITARNARTVSELVRSGPTAAKAASPLAAAASAAKAPKIAPVAVSAGLWQGQRQQQPAPAYAAGGPVKPDPEPTPAQQKAGNYRKHHVRVHGFGIAIETAKGTPRRGVGENGKPWENIHPTAHYGYIKRTKGADGDHVDTYLGPHHDSRKIFVVDQIDPKTGKWDEHKCIIGARSKTQALAIYDAGFSDGSGPRRRARIHETTPEGLRRWLAEGDTEEPFATAA